MTSAVHNPDPRTMIDVAEADGLIAGALPGFGAITVPLSEAGGRILRETVRADRDQPPFDRVTMDGIAFASAVWAGGAREFAVEGIQAAGQPQQRLAAGDGCFEVMTGAVLPGGCDCVAPIEQVTLEGGRARVNAEAAAEEGQHIHRQGTDYEAGAVLLEPGAVLNGPRVAIAASAGKAAVAVAPRLKVAMVSTGDELVSVGAEPAPHQIRRSNGYAVAELLREWLKAETVRIHVPDDPADIDKTLAEILPVYDVFILSGGVSMGRYDHIPASLQRLGVRAQFHKVRQRPGKPLWFGTGPAGKPVFALPGNPVSTTVCALRYVVKHLLEALGGHWPEDEAELTTDYPFKPDLTCFLPVRVRGGMAEPCVTNTSGDFAGLADTDGFIELPRGRDVYPAGFRARLFRWTR